MKLISDEEINTTEMPCDEDSRDCPIDKSNTYDAMSHSCQLCSHRITAQAQLASCEQQAEQEIEKRDKRIADLQETCAQWERLCKEAYQQGLAMKPNPDNVYDNGFRDGKKEAEDQLKAVVKKYEADCSEICTAVKVSQGYKEQLVKAELRHVKAEIENRIWGSYYILPDNKPKILNGLNQFWKGKGIE